MLHDLRSWIGEDPKRMPKTLFKMLRVHHQSGNYGDAACPTLRQVQQSINYVRTKELHHKSTVPAVEEALQHWVLPTAQEDQEIHHPFVFGVEKVDGKPRVGNGGLQSFRVGTIFQCGLDNDTCNDIVYDNNVMHSYSYIGPWRGDVVTDGSSAATPYGSYGMTAAQPSMPSAHFAALTSYNTRRRHRLRAELYNALGSQRRLLNSPPIPPSRGQTPVRMDGVVFFDGASRLDAACEESGALVMPRDYPILCDYDAHYIPTATTNNQAEYDGLLRSLQLATIRGYIHLTVYGDSQLLVRQCRVLGTQESVGSSPQVAAHVAR
ncbi:hypothetical protein DYB36_010052 [Aphanomyces astaci]|uniref:RNase H type-1 domain-containing protein n=1 Tax=Aphanomyces astaci TaxID=112090 RepID=A0A397AFU9_APHAT|nr:hypothetical protein DYB36_010052 [Aphanomyces astaci]